MRRQLLLHVPVLHAGYERLLDQWGKQADSILLIGDSLTSSDKVMSKEIRALSATSVARYLNHRGDLPRVIVAERESLLLLLIADEVVVSDDDFSRKVVDEYRIASRHSVVYDSAFLRWDRSWATSSAPTSPDAVVTLAELDRRFAAVAQGVAERSSDWWRQVGAVAVRGGDVLLTAHNVHMPSEHSPYLNGDPRNAFSRGLHPELSTALHAEAALVGRAAREGVVLGGADIYVSTFPCPGCARLLAATGVARVFYTSGYSMLEGEEVLRAAGVELVFVDTDRSA